MLFFVMSLHVFLNMSYSTHGLHDIFCSVFAFGVAILGMFQVSYCAISHYLYVCQPGTASLWKHCG